MPIFNDGNRKIISNYCPITVLSDISKLFEKALKIRTQVFLDKFKLLAARQFGFIAFESTNHALPEVFSFIYDNLDTREVCTMLFVDIHKAFHVVNDEKLLDFMYQIGFSGLTFDCLASYLSNNRWRIVVSGSFSNVGTINFRVPHESVLRSLFILIFFNCIFNDGLRENLVAFADYLSISFGSTSKLDLVADIVYDLYLSRWWFADHNLVSSSKTK